MTLGLNQIIELTVPQYLLISILSPIASYMIVYQHLPDFSLIPIIIVLSFAVLGFNVSNMIYDSDLDAINKPKRPIPSGKSTKQEARMLSIACYTISMITAIATRNAWIILLTIAFIALSIIYSAPPLRLRNYWWGSSFTGAILYGTVPFLSVEALNGSVFDHPIFLAFFIALFIIISNTKDFEDSAGEKKMNISSIATIFGEQTGAYLLIISNIVLLVAIGVLSANKIISTKYLVATGISFFILILVSISFIKDIKEIKARNYIVEKIKDTNEFNETLQSDAVTISVLYAIIVELIFGFASI